MYLEVKIQFNKQGANGEAKGVITTNKTRLKQLRVRCNNQGGTDANTGKVATNKIRWR